MTRLSRDELAAATATGLITLVGRRVDGNMIVDSTCEAWEQAFAAADYALALSAPDAIEALEALVEAVDRVDAIARSRNEQLQWHAVGKAHKAARAVLARYKGTTTGR